MTWHTALLAEEDKPGYMSASIHLRVALLVLEFLQRIRVRTHRGLRHDERCCLDEEASSSCWQGSLRLRHSVVAMCMLYEDAIALNNTAAYAARKLSERRSSSNGVGGRLSAPRESGSTDPSLRLPLPDRNFFSGRTSCLLKSGIEVLASIGVA